jgi:hypothetical protein
LTRRATFSLGGLPGIPPRWGSGCCYGRSITRGDAPGSSILDRWSRKIPRTPQLLRQVSTGMLPRCQRGPPSPNGAKCNSQGHRPWTASPPAIRLKPQPGAIRHRSRTSKKTRTEFGTMIATGSALRFGIPPRWGLGRCYGRSITRGECPWLLHFWAVGPDELRSAIADVTAISRCSRGSSAARDALQPQRGEMR